MSKEERFDKIDKIICKINFLENIENIADEEGLQGLRFYLQEIREELESIVSE